MFFCEGEPSVYKGHLFGVSPYGLYVVAHNNDGTLVVIEETVPDAVSSS